MGGRSDIKNAAMERLAVALLAFAAAYAAAAPSPAPPQPGSLTVEYLSDPSGVTTRRKY